MDPTNDTKQDKTTEAMRYRTADAKRRRRYRQYAKLPAEDLRGEVTGLRVFAAEAYEQGNIALYNVLTTSIAKVARDQTALKRMNQEFLDRDEVRRLGERLCKIVLGALKDRFLGWEQTVDEVIAELKVAVEEPCEESNEQ